MEVAEHLREISSAFMLELRMVPCDDSDFEQAAGEHCSNQLLLAMAWLDSLGQGKPVHRRPHCQTADAGMPVAPSRFRGCRMPTGETPDPPSI